ncbi:MAG TPA: hypothetical protein VGQ71_08425, partial [Terriglobales bacterium]|nr:hypothetical protein [Terriglobales bacterium]
VQRTWTFSDRYKLQPSVEIFNVTNHDNFRFPVCDELQGCLLGTIGQIAGDSRRAQLGLRFEW